jgi:hypothetical protein
MTNKKVSREKISKIIGAKHREAVTTPFYYAPPFLDQVRDELTRQGGDYDKGCPDCGAFVS